MSLEIKQEILNNIKQDCDLDTINKELDVMESTEGLDGRSNLENFYDVFKDYKGQTGTENDINSLTAWAIGLTSKKPEGGFLQERRAFARAGFPDIDSDFDYFRRDEVYEYIIEKYGRDNVANIGTYIGLKTRMALTRVTKALDIAQAWFKGKQEFVSENMHKVEEITNTLPDPRGNSVRVKDEHGQSHLIKTVQDAYKYIPDFKFYMDKYPELYKHTKNVEGLLSSASQHPAGIVISSEPLQNIAPVRRTKVDQYATQYVYEDLEKMGEIKYDILATAILTSIDRTVKMVKEDYGIDIDVVNLPLDDEPTLALYRTGKLNGVFQCENYGMQNTLVDIGVDKFDDIVAAIALFRPGPMASIPEFCARKRGDSPIDYFHPSIEPFVKKHLEKTYGIICYQESVMQICNSLAGFSISDGYVMIKGITKKKQHIIDKFQKQFIEGCVKNKVPEQVAKNYWKNFITPFASYGFNIAHSLCYGFTSYTSAYLKANYTAEFMVCSLNVANEGKKHDRVVKLERDLKKFNIKLGPKNINDCDVAYKIVKRKDDATGIESTVVSPSVMVKGIGYESAKVIANNRPYSGFKNFVAKTLPVVDQESVGALYDAGFFKNQVKQYYKETKEKLTRDLLLEKFVIIRKDMNEAAKRGVDSTDLFA